jgi:hypothetical protein
MSTSSVNALLRAAKSCVDEAAKADRVGRHRYAELIRASARRALAELDAVRPRAPVDPETAQRQEKARIFAKVLLRGLH